MTDTDVQTIKEDEESEDYLSIRDAAAEFRVNASVIRKAVKEGSIRTQAHAWGVRVRRRDVAQLAQTTSNQSLAAAAALPRRRVARELHQTTYGDVDNQIDQQVLAVVGEIGPATLARLHEALRPKLDLTFASVVYSTRRLVAANLLGRRKEGKGDVYELRRLSPLVQEAPT